MENGYSNMEHMDRDQLLLDAVMQNTHRCNFGYDSEHTTSKHGYAHLKRIGDNWYIAKDDDSRDVLQVTLEAVMAEVRDGSSKFDNSFTLENNAGPRISLGSWGPANSFFSRCDPVNEKRADEVRESMGLTNYD
jgi:hypothetical protein